jgi:hypothetical protein
MMGDNHGEYVFFCRTVKASPVRTLVDAVKDILTEVNLEIDAAGIKIMAMDGTHTILVHMRLYADRFDEFRCAEKCILGIDFVNFNKMVKQIKNEDSLVLFMENGQVQTFSDVSLDDLWSENTPINIDLIYVLVTAFSNKVQILDKFGKIPLHYACQSNAPFEVIKCLVENFDGIKVKSKDGKLALNFSLLANAPFEVIKYLLISYPNGVEQRLSLSYLSPSSLTLLTCEKVLKENGYIVWSIVGALRTISKSLVGKQACLDAGAHLALTELINEKVVKEDGTIAGSVAGALWNIAMTDAGCESCIEVGVPRSLIILAKEKAIQESSFEIGRASCRERVYA